MRIRSRSFSVSGPYCESKRQSGAFKPRQTVWHSAPGLATIFPPLAAAAVLMPPRNQGAGTTHSVGLTAVHPGGDNLRH